MSALTKAAVAVSSLGLVLTGATLGSAFAEDPEPNTTPATPTSARQLAATTKPRLFAVVREDGTLHSGRGATAAAQDGTGVYQVRFERRISGCAWVGRSGRATSSAAPAPGRSHLRPQRDLPGSFVTTFDGSGDAANLPFHVVVTCS